MKLRGNNVFSTVRTEGAILPADLLQRIALGDGDFDGFTPAAYHLLEGEKLNEVTNRSWNRLRGAWVSFKGAVSKLPSNDLCMTVTRDRWLLPLFQELDYGRLTSAKVIDVEGKSYPISYGWQHTPIHLVGCRVELDKRTAGVAGAARSSPHSLVQELLNRSDNHLWAFVSNGLRLRILRDNVSLTRQAYVEFDLEAMMQGEVYADFVLLWLLCHQSRVEAEKPEECWLEKWSRTAQEQGTRALEQLRNGVEEAIAAFGRGFLTHPANRSLREQLRSGELNTQDYYRQLLRLVYRLLFLFVAEDRQLLLDPAADPASQERYTRFYSTAKLRQLAERRRGTRHSDLFYGLRLVMEKLGSDTGCPELRLPALGSFLFSKAAIPALEGCQIGNTDLLDAVRALAFITDRAGRRPVDYKNLKSEELGSVYEALLELHPVLNTSAGTFELQTASGNERKTTGSYYTPESLVQCLLDSALDPVLDDAIQQPNPEVAILNLKICDPACGSGHFLIQSAHRMAKRLASVRTGDEEPSPADTRKALRDVIGRCIYGVDANPMAVELCKVALWMEALEPGKPLSFLDHHIQCGNSLLGATPALLRKGIPDEAFNPIEGDDKPTCTKYKRLNKEQREKKQLTLFDENLQPWERLGDLATGMMNLDAIADDSIAGVRRKQEQYESLVKSSPYLFSRFWADAWCAAFAWKKQTSDELPYPITEEVFWQIERNPYNAPEWMHREIQRLAAQYGFFHWHLAFPDVFRVTGVGEEPENEPVGWCGGFDVVLGNPPWERINLEARQFFSTTRPDVAIAPTARRKTMIEALAKEDPKLYTEYREAQRAAAAEISLCQNSGRYPHLNQARLNTYVLFVELNTTLCTAQGRCGIIVPSGVATDDISRHLFEFLLSTNRLVSLFDFENREGIFPGVDRRYKFCILTLSGSSHSEKATDFVFFAHKVEDLSNKSRHFSLSGKELRLLSPITGLCPSFRSSRDRQMVLQIHQRVAPFILQKQTKTAWIDSDFLIMFRSESSSHLYKTPEELGLNFPYLLGIQHLVIDGTCYLPVWESKLMHQFEHRYATYEGVTLEERAAGKPREVLSSEKSCTWSAQPRNWVIEQEVQEILRRRGHKHQWIIGYRDVTRATDQRTAIASVLPIGGASQPLNLFLPESAWYGALWLAAINSFVLDYVVRQTIGGIHLNITTCRQLPIISEVERLSGFSQLIRDCICELVYTSPTLEAFAKDLGYNCSPFRWDEERRFLLRCELDAAYFHLYGIERDDVDYIMETFPIVKRKDKQKYGEYRTKKVILEVYDAMTESMTIKQPYKTILNPPPADPAVAHQPR